MREVAKGATSLVAEATKLLAPNNKICRLWGVIRILASMRVSGGCRKRSTSRRLLQTSRDRRQVAIGSKS